jgi:hypothetical protein
VFRIWIARNKKNLRKIIVMASKSKRDEMGHVVLGSGGV